MLKNYKLTVGVLASTLALSLTACTNVTSTAGTVSYFEEGFIRDIEVIDINQDKYDTTKNVALGAAGGALVGQLIGKDTAGTLIGAGIGAAVAGGVSSYANRADGMRLTIETAQGLKLVDTYYSCMFQEGAAVRVINPNGKATIQVLNGNNYRTATRDSKEKCPM